MKIQSDLTCSQSLMHSRSSTHIRFSEWLNKSLTILTAVCSGQERKDRKAERSGLVPITLFFHSRQALPAHTHTVLAKPTPRIHCRQIWLCLTLSSVLEGNPQIKQSVADCSQVPRF